MPRLRYGGKEASHAKVTVTEKQLVILGTQSVAFRGC